MNVTVHRGRCFRSVAASSVGDAVAVPRSPVRVISLILRAVGSSYARSSTSAQIMTPGSAPLSLSGPPGARRGSLGLIGERDQAIRLAGDRFGSPWRGVGNQIGVYRRRAPDLVPQRGFVAQLRLH